MAQLKSGHRTVKSIFHLRGFKEVHMTDGLAFVLSRVPRLLESLLKVSGSRAAGIDEVALYTQRTSQDKGRTDIELVGPAIHIISEAKLGPRIPSQAQLAKYVKRLHTHRKATSELLVVSDSEPGYATEQLDSYGFHVPLRFISWRQIHDAAEVLAKELEHVERIWVDELLTYLRDHLRRVESPENVRIVALNRRCQPGRALSSIELLKQQKRYIHPVGNGYPTQPAWLLGFRYDGRLQAVHPVRNVRRVSKLPDEFASSSTGIAGSHFIYELGPAIPLAAHKTPGMPWAIRSGKIWDRPLCLPLAALGDFETLAQASADRTAQRKRQKADKQVRGK